MFYKTWTNNDIYNIIDEFNRIEKYNEYIYYWLKNYYNISIQEINNKTNWTINDIPDLQDYNRIKGNINLLLSIFNSTSDRLIISNSVNQKFDGNKANELEVNLWQNLYDLTNLQFQYKICGLTSCGSNDLNLNLG